MIETGIIIKKIFDPYFEAPLEIWESFATFLKRNSYKKNEIIKEVNKKENNLSIIVNGSAGIFLWRENSTICLDLCYENEFFGDYMSFLTQESTELFTQAIEPTEILSISYSDLNELYKNSTIGVNIGRIASESLFIHKQTQQIDLLMLTAEKRYLKLLERQPKIVQRTPQKHIASYLGITPESFSRIRKKITL
ncbi:Crp/Fnr family transcriptional regulator [uncultured Polaribacter sp.]|uniref:Crp/Fnr family transcriptional regulator n=1 Tax=uncultured Polaribacter sp. TaxID=174711 RepID=UPI0026391360|nr:Crp/Fnr family transcriptional regulator [uncultured Polaribacter sp.]